MTNHGNLAGRQRRFGQGCGLLAAVLLLLTTAGPGNGGLQAQRIAEAGGVVDVAIPASQDETPQQPEAGTRYIGGAPLKTDPDLMDRLEKADQFRRDGSYRAASRLWQSVLEESGDTLYTEDNETYFSLTERVESILAGLPSGGLSAYRIAADAAAREILAAGSGDLDLDTLGRIVKGYFMSSFGDEAAYQLGCIYLDDYDFVGAARLLRKITDRYPDPTVPLDQVWLRIAIARAYIGDRESAREALDKALQAGADPGSRLGEAVEELLREGPQWNQTAATTGQWVTRLGSVRRRGLMPTLPASLDGSDLKADWQYYFEPADVYVGDDYAGTVIDAFDPPAIRESAGKRERDLWQAWRKGRWRPAGHLLFADQLVAFKSGADIVVWSRPPAENPLWRPLWLNQFVVDDATAQWKMLYDNYRYERSNRTRTAPSSPREVQLFGDQIAQSMSIHRGVLYNVEGEEYSWKADRVPNVQRQQRSPYGSLPRRTRTNRLSAYDLQTGKILWRLPTMDLLAVTHGEQPVAVSTVADPPADEKPFEDVGFMAAPVGFGELLLAPVNVSGSIYVYAMDSRNQGQLVWRSYLCDEPGGGSQAWSPIHLAIEGSTAYATCGTGVVFAIDPMTGGIRYARRYARTGEPNNYLRRFGGNAETLELDGWQEDLVIPLGNDLVMMASDFNVLWAIDRQTARFRWKTDNRPFGKKFDYLIGINEDYIYLGGPEAVAAISIKAEGRWEWVHDLQDDVSLGRAMLTGNGVYVPLENRILKLGLTGRAGAGDVQAEMKVRLGTDAPLGNLYSDGQRIWVLGANRLYALGTDDGSIPDQPATDESADGEDPQDGEVEKEQRPQRDDGRNREQPDRINQPQR
jgi:tetratricopeptide (TPR) repeat protein